MGYNCFMVIEFGVVNYYDFEYFKCLDIWVFVENVEVYYVGGYYFIVCFFVIQELVKQVVEKNKLFILSLFVFFICQFFKELFDVLVLYWDYVIGNEGEVVVYFESYGFGLMDVKEIVKVFVNLFKINIQWKCVVIIIQGIEFIVVVIQGEDEVKEYFVYEFVKEFINDINGVGDVFVGGFCVGIVDGYFFEEVVNMGQWLVCLSIQELGFL